MTSRHLRLHHELLLLALHDRKGTVAFGSMQHIGLAGGLFAELILEERLRIVTETKGRRTREWVEVADASRTGEDTLDAALARLAARKRRASPRDAVLSLSRLKDLRHKVARELVRKGVLRATEDEVLIFFKRRVYPTLDPGPERALVGRIQTALEDPSSVPDGRTALLVALAHATSTLRAVYDRKGLKALTPRIEALAEEAGSGAEAAADAIRAAQAAVMAATTAAVTAATTASAAG